MTMKVRKVNAQNPKTQAKGFAARAITNGKESFEDICEQAGLNTTMNVAELEAAGKLILQAAARELKNGKIVDLGPIGAIYPAVSGKWAEKAEDLQKSDLTLKVNYRPTTRLTLPSRVPSWHGQAPRTRRRSRRTVARTPRPIPTRAATAAAPSRGTTTLKADVKREQSQNRF